MADGLDQTLGRIDAVTRGLAEGSRDIVLRHAAAAVPRAQTLLRRVDTGQTKANIGRRDYTADEQRPAALVYVQNVGVRYRGHGGNPGEQRPENLPLWIERGTRGVSGRGQRRAALWSAKMRRRRKRARFLTRGAGRMAPAPFLEPAAEQGRDAFRRDLEQMRDRVISQQGR